MTISGTPSVGGILSLYVGADRVQVPVGLENEPSEIAEAAAAAINAKPDLPVTAAASKSQDDAEVEEGYVTISAKK